MRRIQRLAILGALALQLFAPLDPTIAGETLVVAVRHAEKESSPSDPGLTAEGLDRANHLARTLADLEIDAVYSTPFNRTQQTATPLADSKGLQVLMAPTESHAELMAKTIRERHEGEVVIVVGHSNTTPALAAALGVENPPEISEATYDRLFIIRLTPEGARFLPLRYGQSSP